MWPDAFAVRMLLTDCVRSDSDPRSGGWCSESPATLTNLLVASLSRRRAAPFCSLRLEDPGARATNIERAETSREAKHRRHAHAKCRLAAAKKRRFPQLWDRASRCVDLAANSGFRNAILRACAIFRLVDRWGLCHQLYQGSKRLTYRVERSDLPSWPGLARPSTTVP